MRLPEGEGWLTCAEVAAIWKLSPGTVTRYARQRGLTLFEGRTPRRKFWYREEEVWAMALEPEWVRRLEKRAARCARVARLREAGLGQPDAEMLTCREAAESLGISPSTLVSYVQAHRLFAAQKHPGQPGSRYLFPRRVIECFRNWPERVKRNAMVRRSRGNYRSQGSGLEPEEAWLVTAQVMDWMQICDSTLRKLRRAGRIGFVRQTGLDVSGHPVWRYLHRKADIVALLADPRYQAGRQRYVKAQQTREARAVAWTMKVNGWDDPWHTFDYQGSPGIW